jgi:lactoylglutathione lyase
MAVSALFDHFNFNVMDLEKSLAFYEKALGLTEKRRVEGDGFTLAYLGDSETAFRLELTWIKSRKEPYDLGEREFHLCLAAAGDYDAAKALHKEMGCVCYENDEMGLYFITDPDGYWIEMIPSKRP